VAYSFWNTLSGVGAGADATDEHALKLQNQLDSRYPQPQHIIEYTHDLIQRNKLRFDKSANDDRTVPPPPQQKVDSIIVLRSMSTKLLQTALITSRGRIN
jgi:hypothetical protein